MSDKTDATPAPDAAAFDPTTCPHWGKGGRYVIDITNGRRVPVEEMEAQAQAAVAVQDKPAKEKKRA